MNEFCFLIFSLVLIKVDANLLKVLNFQPDQVHIAFGENVREIVVMWSTTDATNDSVVKYSLHDEKFKAVGEANLFVDGGPKRHQQYIHKVKLTNLKPDSHYAYNCGSELGWSNQFWFKTPPADENNWTPHLAIFGDMGLENAQSLPRLQWETEQHMYDAIFHVGDFAYDFDSNDALTGDKFMSKIQSIAAHVPYMVCVGNHEEKYNFSNYRNRFGMPGHTESLYYSFNMGPIHFISISTELYYFLNYGVKPLANQYDWLVNDLREANKPENRKLQPWIITFGHRPMYCSNDDDIGSCREQTTLIRKGLPITHLYGLEDLFQDNGVDISVWAHEHSYERLWPIYNFEVKNGSFEEPYKNANAPVHIITGSAGCKEEHAKFVKNPPKWSAFRSQDYGYTRMKALNKTHLYFEQVSVEKNGEIIDSFWVVKEQIIPSYANLNALH